MSTHLHSAFHRHRKFQQRGESLLAARRRPRMRRGCQLSVAHSPRCVATLSNTAVAGYQSLSLPPAHVYSVRTGGTEQVCRAVGPDYHVGLRRCQYTLASPCFTLLHPASPCFTLLHSASICFRLLHAASPCITLLHPASLCFNLLHAATRCFTLLHPASPCFTLLHSASP